MRGDYANLTAVIDLTLSRLDSSFFTGTRFECNLTELELQWAAPSARCPAHAPRGALITPATPWLSPTTSTRGADIVLTRRIKIQLLVFGVVTLLAGTLMFVNYMQVPTEFFGLDRYTVTVQFPEGGGLYRGATTYRGVEVGRVRDVRLTNSGAEAVLQMNSDVHIPADLGAQVHSVSAVGEQYVELLPRSDNGPSLKDGDVITVDRTTIPPNLNSLLLATNRGLSAIRATTSKRWSTSPMPPSADSVRSCPDWSGTTDLAIDARTNLDAIVALIDQSKPVLDSQTHSSDAVQAGQPTSRPSPRSFETTTPRWWACCIRAAQRLTRPGSCSNG